MKVKVDDVEIIVLSEIKKKVIKNDIPSSLFKEDMERRIKWVLMHKYEMCFDRIQKEWMPKLSERMDSIPTDPEKLADLIFSQPDYQDREEREKSVEK